MLFASRQMFTREMLSARETSTFETSAKRQRPGGLTFFISKQAAELAVYAGGEEGHFRQRCWLARRLCRAGVS